MSLQSSVQPFSDDTSLADIDVLHYTLVADDAKSVGDLQSFRTLTVVMNSAAERVGRRAVILNNIDTALWLFQKNEAKRQDT